MIMTLYKFIDKKYAFKNRFPSKIKNIPQLSENDKDTDKYDNMEIRKRMNNMEVSIGSLMLKLDAVCKRLNKLDQVLKH